MGAFLSIAKGSDEPLKFVEVIYNGADPKDPPFALVGKGVTFDRLVFLKSGILKNC